jgi:hypothetical protein
MKDEVNNVINETEEFYCKSLMLVHCCLNYNKLTVLVQLMMSFCNNAIEYSTKVEFI